MARGRVAQSRGTVSWLVAGITVGDLLRRV